MPSLLDSFDAVLEALHSVGPPFPPAETGASAISFPVLVASLLSQLAAANQAKLTWEALQSAGFQTVEEIAQADLPALVEAAETPDGPLQRLSSKTLKPVHLLARWIVGRGGLDALAAVPTEELRGELVQIKGITPAAADALLLYGLKRPVFPADQAAFRVLTRHAWVEPTSDYEEVRAVVEEGARGDHVALSTLNVRFDRIAEQYCRARRPLCDGCPLEPFLPDGGPREAFS